MAPICPAGKLTAARRRLGRWQRAFFKPGKGMIRTRAEFTDIQLHVEFATPSTVVGSSQDRGNSGVFLAGALKSRCSIVSRTRLRGRSSRCDVRPASASRERFPRAGRVAILRHRLYRSQIHLLGRTIIASHRDRLSQRGVSAPRPILLGRNGSSKNRAYNLKWHADRFDCRTMGTLCVTAISGCAR